MKDIHFQVPDALFEAFHKVLPVRGEKTLFFTRLMEMTVEKAKERDAFLESIWRESREREEDQGE